MDGNAQGVHRTEATINISSNDAVVSAVSERTASCLFPSFPPPSFSGGQRTFPRKLHR